MSKLLFDENVSSRLVSLLEKEFPGSTHVNMLGLQHQSDSVVWRWAKENQHCIVTKDSDFNDMVIAQGIPPKVILLTVGNRSTDDLAKILKARVDAITDFIADDHASILILSGK